MILGVQTSSVGVEGVHPSADWSVWERDERVPRSADGNGFATNHGDDFLLLAEHGIGAHRVTIEWARIEPQSGRIDTNAVDRYTEILRSAERAGVQTWLSLQHTTLPGWFADDEGGFASTQARELHWARHVDRCGEWFGDFAAVWVPIEDPVGWATRGYRLATRPPGVRDPVRAGAAAEGALLANLVAWRLLHSGSAPVMTVHGAPTVFALDPNAEPYVDDWDRWFWGPWIGMLDDGVIEIPDRRPLRVEEAAQAFDLVGISFDAPIGVDENGLLGPYPADARRTDNGLAPNPEELGVALRRAHELLPDRTLVVASTGFATEDDDWRDDLLNRSLGEVRRAAQDGVPVEAFFHDTAIDGYEWTRGFATSKGLFDRDRRPRPSLARLR